MKIFKKLFITMLLIILAITFTCSTVFATGLESKTTVSLKLVKDTSCTIDLDGKANFEKKLSNFDAEKKTATLTLTVKNTMPKNATQDMEIFFVIDNSTSMTENKVGNVTRKAKVIESANLLVDKLFEVNPKTKIGIVSFSSLDSAKGETEGTINDAKLEAGISTNKSDIKSTISGIEATETGPRTNIDAGLQVAMNNFPKDSNVTSRYIVLLTDGVPNNDTKGEFGTFKGKVAENTKATIENIQNKHKVKIIGAMLGLDSDHVETQSGKTYQALSEEVFGSIENPTISSYYYVTDEHIEKTITDDIYNGLVTVVDNELKNLVIKDFFPQEIIDNFTFSYTKDPNLGKVSAEVNKKDNSITWNIESLKFGEEASLSYTLTLKDDFDKTIIDKVLPTNTKVDFSADNNGKTIAKTSDVSPQIQVLATTEVIDKTIADKKIPQTGEASIGVILAIAVVIVIATIFGIRYVYLKNVIK